jgi:hypothetical protein
MRHIFDADDRGHVEPRYCDSCVYKHNRRCSQGASQRHYFLVSPLYDSSCDRFADRNYVVSITVRVREADERNAMLIYNFATSGGRVVTWSDRVPLYSQAAVRSLMEAGYMSWPSNRVSGGPGRHLVSIEFSLVLSPPWYEKHVLSSVHMADAVRAPCQIRRLRRCAAEGR